MTTYTAEYASTKRSPVGRALRRAEIALAVALTAGIPFAAIGLVATLTPNDHPFRHAADYWYTALGIPYLAAPIMLLTSLKSLYGGRDGRLGTVGVVVTGAALATIDVALLPYSLTAGTTAGTGPAYPIAAFTADVGMVLFCVGALRVRLLPRTLVAAWLAAWVIGGALGPAWGAPLLVAVYAVIAATLPKRVTSLESPRVRKQTHEPHSERTPARS